MRLYSTLRYFALVAALIAAATSALAANDPLGLTPSSAANSLGIESNQDEFLRVEQAYQVNLRYQGDQQLLLDWQIEPGYYLYKNNFTFKANGQTLPAEYQAGVVKFDDYFQEELEIFQLQTQVALKDLPSPPFQLEVTSQGCADAGLCYPPRKQLFDIQNTTGPILEVNPSADTGSRATKPSAMQTPFSLGTWLASLLFALLGGLILNLMPCVFPVLSIKALSLANSQQNEHRLHLHGWAYTAGCVATFVAIAAAMLMLRAGGAAIGWGFQLQSPVVIAFLLYLFFVMGLSLAGAVNLGSSLMGLGQSATQGSRLHHSWMTGALASIVASPCTAPLMGAALGYAVTQPAVVALSIFGALGFGMALPFLLLTYVPTAITALPKPGPWMETLKQALAFPMFLSCVWLLWVLTNQTDANHLAIISFGLVLIAFALWLWQHLPHKPVAKRLGQTAASICVAIAALAAVTYQPPKDDPLWQAYSPQRLAQLRSDGQGVFINLTASWCLTCLANERVALSSDSVRQVMNQQNIQGLKGDWTNADPEITELLQQYGRSGVPLYLYFPPDTNSNAVILPQLLTPEIVLNTFQARNTDNLATIDDI